MIYALGHLHWYMWGGATEDTTEMLSMSRPLPSTVIVGVPARKYTRHINFNEGRRTRVRESRKNFGRGPRRACRRPVLSELSRTSFSPSAISAVRANLCSLCRIPRGFAYQETHTERKKYLRDNKYFFFAGHTI